ncbi:hypothetical protein [Clostridium beijerinckii]|uniref:Phage gp6-like head-tail connector protein n=1 Tax=Clostridium beijerinckii TaxID=1520 RepID=A0AAE5HBD2_CLOBE|nr:hypothetical protein [Clostridium beijerinckii]NSB17441.1 hypothetical protein [Clostridium beijerinckii]OOM28448.1 hypothetical protein CLOBE_27040 [Clostridium beijerinckii]
MTFTDDQLEQMAISAIIEYKNKDYTSDEIKTLYPLGILLIVENIKKSLAVDKNFTQVTQGSRSVTYNKDNTIIDDSVKKILGKPYLRCF